MFKQALAGYEKAPRLESLDRIRAVEDLEVILHDCKKYKEAETMLKKALAGYLNVFGPELPDTCKVVEKLSVFDRDYEFYKAEISAKTPQLSEI